MSNKTKMVPAVPIDNRKLSKNMTMISLVKNDNKKLTMSPIAKIDNSIIRNLIDDVDSIDFNDTIIELTLSILGISKEYYYNSTLSDFNEFIVSFKKTMIDKNQLNAIKILLKHKKMTSQPFVVYSQSVLNKPTNNIFEQSIPEQFNDSNIKPINVSNEAYRQHVKNMYKNSITSSEFV